MGTNTMLDLPAIKKLCEAASEAPWEVGHEPQLNMVAECGDTRNGQSLYVFAYRLAPAQADAEFIAACRTNVPALVEELTEARGKLEVVERAAENYAGQAGRDPLFDAGMIAAGEGILAILGESE